MISIRNNRTKKVVQVTEAEYEKINNVFPGRFSKVKAKEISVKAKEVIKKAKKEANKD